MKRNRNPIITANEDFQKLVINLMLLLFLINFDVMQTNMITQAHYWDGQLPTLMSTGITCLRMNRP